MPDVVEVLIAGNRVEPTGAETWVVTNPSTVRPLGAVRSCDEQQWQTALNAAREAHPVWRQCTAPQRTKLLAEVAEKLLANQRDIAMLHSRETGQVMTESLDMVERAAKYWRGDCSTNEVDATAPLCLIRPRPDEALLDWSRIAAERLAHGICCLTAVPVQAPLALLAAATACDGLPKGVMSVLVGDAACQTDADIDSASPVDPPMASNVVYISSDADLELAAAGAAAKRLYHAGQSADQSVRVYVAQSHIYAFADHLHPFLAFLEAGDPVKSASDLGPLSSARRLQEVEAQVADTLRLGALLKLGGRRYQPWGLTGYFFQPTLMIEGVGEERAPHDQIRGPVIILAPARDLAAALADRPPTSRTRISLFTRDVERTIGHANIDATRVHIEHVTEQGNDWFPYQRRKMRL